MLTRDGRAAGVAQEATGGVERWGLGSDETVARLARMFLEHPAWVEAAKRMESGATSTVLFSHRPGESWRLERREDQTLLLPGAASEPDFVFCFTPASIERLASVGGGIGDVAVELFTLMTAESPSLRVGFRIVASFPKLVRRGYLGLLAAGGRRLLAFGAGRGVRTLADLRRLVERVRERGREEWELDGPGGRPDDSTHRLPF